MRNNYLLNLDTLSVGAFAGILALDKTFIGTPYYIGVAWFWNYEYRHYLRDATIHQRRRVHQKFLDAKIDIAGKSPLHLEIVEKFCR